MKIRPDTLERIQRQLLEIFSSLPLSVRNNIETTSNQLQDVPEINTEIQGVTKQ